MPTRPTATSRSALRLLALAVMVGAAGFATAAVGASDGVDAMPTAPVTEQIASASAPAPAADDATAVEHAAPAADGTAEEPEASAAGSMAQATTTTAAPTTTVPPTTAPPTTVAAVSAPAPTAPAPPPPPPPPPGPSTPQNATRHSGCEQYMYEQINAARARAGRPALAFDGGIQYIAVAWSDQLAGTQVLAHSPDYGDQILRHRDYRTAGENVGRGHELASLFQAFMDSPGHRRNIESDAYHSVTTGCVTDATGQFWITQNFWG